MFLYKAIKRYFVGALSLVMLLSGPLKAQEEAGVNRVAVAIVDQSRFSDDPIVVVVGPRAWPSMDALIVIREGGLSEEGLAQALLTARVALARLREGDRTPQDLVVRGVPMNARSSGGETVRKTAEEEMATELLPVLSRQHDRSLVEVARGGEAALSPPDELRAIGASRIRGLLYVSLRNSR